MLDTPCSEVVWRVLATHSIRQFHLHFPSCASLCAITFQLDCTSKTKPVQSSCNKSNTHCSKEQNNRHYSLDRQTDWQTNIPLPSNVHFMHLTQRTEKGWQGVNWIHLAHDRQNGGLHWQQQQNGGLHWQQQQNGGLHWQQQRNFCFLKMRGISLLDEKLAASNK
jgi:hypothetical protein